MTAYDLACDFRSDTVTRPTPEMKEAMVAAPLGDDVYGEDPTVNALQAEAARLTGHEAGLFFPSGTMANTTALTVHGAPGRILYAGARSHVKLFEMGGYARIAGLNLVEIDDSRGALDLEQLRRVWSPQIYYLSQPGVVAVENTHNMLGGKIYPEAELARLAAFVRERGIPLHMDGARLVHAARACGKPLTHWSRHVDSVMFCVSKGLGAPAGSLLTGSRDFIEEGRKVRKLLGGGMRQAGVLAAAGLYALEHHLPLLDRDHRRCRHVYDAIRDLDWLDATEPDTNILIVRLRRPCAAELVAALAAQGLHFLALGPDSVRLVFHLNLSDEACDRLVGEFLRFGA